MLPGQAANGLAGLLIGPGSDGAGVHQHQIRPHPRGCGLPAPGCELPGHPGRITLVHLAAESEDMKDGHKVILS
jgi:hypothetical protein